jgi:myo-inositol-hexaphosphate 3-phosphohydrolase
MHFNRFKTASTKRGKVWQYQVGLKENKAQIALVRKLKFGKTVEGLVVDPTNKKLYVASTYFVS